MLLEFPGLVDALERKDVSFIEKLLRWIKKGEDIFSSHNLSQTSELAGLRSKILSPKFSDDKVRPSRKVQLSIASELLYDIQHVVLKQIVPHEANVQECRELIRQLLLIVAQSKAIQYDPDTPFEMFVNNVWQFINSNDQLRPGLIKLRSSLSNDDIRILIAEEIELEEMVLTG